jgi:hypothetical protein
MEVVLAFGLCGLMVAACPAQSTRESGYGRQSAAEDLRQVEVILDAIPVTELLGPLAPVALSPFFGLACLSGTTLLVNRGVLPDNPFLQGNSALNHPVVFAAFLVLALATSVPRLSKVSKPLAQLLDLAETYAGIVAVLVIQWAAHLDSGSPDTSVVSAGFLATGVEGLLMAASVANILVIQTVRFFFEMLILLSPIPLIDALFEVANKALCAGLVAVYALSPAAAFAMNLVVFLVCLAMFGWAHRRTGYLKAVALQPLWNWIRRMRQVDFSGASLPPPQRRQFPRAWFAVQVFPSRPYQGLKPYAACWLVHDGDQLRVVRGSRWGRAWSQPIPESAGQGRVETGLIANAFTWPGGGRGWPRWLFSRSYNPVLPAIAEALDLEFARDGSVPVVDRISGFGRSLRDGVQARKVVPDGLGPG